MRKKLLKWEKTQDLKTQDAREEERCDAALDLDLAGGGRGDAGEDL